jgi:hypothetical protein
VLSPAQDADALFGRNILASLPSTEEAALPDNEAADLARYGISRVRSHSYHLGDFRYSNIADAVAQARRVERSAKDGE